MVAVSGPCPAKKYKEKAQMKIRAFGLDPNKDIINFSNDGCSTMKKLGRLVKPILMQLCLAHGGQLGVLDVFYKKNNDDEDSDDENDQDVSDEDDDEDFDQEDDEFDNDDDLEDESGLIDETNEEFAELKDIEIKDLIAKCRKIVNKYSGRSTNNHALLQDAIKDWQRKNGKSPIGQELGRDCKTRWSSMVLSLLSIKKVKVPLKKVMKDSTLALTDEEFKKIDELVEILMPVKIVMETIGGENADLMTAELAFNELFNDLKSKESELAQDLYEALRRRVKDRWNPVLAGLLKYLHNPTNFTKPSSNLDPMFKIPSRKKMEDLALDLLCRHFGHNDLQENETEIAVVENEELSFAERLNAKLSQNSEESATIKKNSFEMKKEMDLFQITGERSKNLELLYKILQNVAPTSVASERAFSISSNFVSKKRSRLSDKSIDNLCFLKGVFK